MPLAELETRLQSLRLDLERRSGQRDVTLAELKKQEANVVKRTKSADIARKATEVVQAAIETRKQELRERVEFLVTRGLRAVFGRADMEFFFHTRLTGGIVGVVPQLRSKFKDRVIETNIVDGHGGGVADVISFLLRVIVLSLSRPKLAPFLILDEPFRHVSLEYLRGCATLLRELNKNGGIQFLLVTHKPDLLDAADVVYRTKMVDGATEFEIEHDLRDDIFHQKAPKEAKPLPPPEVLPWKGRKTANMGISEKVVTVEVKTDDPLSRAQHRERPEKDAAVVTHGPRWGAKKREKWTKQKKREIERRERGDLTEDPEES